MTLLGCLGGPRRTDLGNFTWSLALPIWVFCPLLLMCYNPCFLHDISAMEPADYRLKLPTPKAESTFTGQTGKLVPSNGVILEYTCPVWFRKLWEKFGRIWSMKLEKT